MNRRPVSYFALLCALLLLTAPGWSVTTSYWESSYQDQFIAGEAKDVSIHSDGRVTLGPRLNLLADTEELFVWSLAEGSGGTIYAGTGNNGKVFKISGDGKANLLYDSDELEILCLAPGRDGRIYAGTAPGGQVIRISDKGDEELFYATGEDHVWALVFDDKGNLFCGTGAEGKIFKVSSKGEGALFYDTKETNVTALAWREGHLYAGGQGNGLVYKIDSDGQALMLFDAQEEEIRSLVFGPDGTLYVAATSGERPGRRPPKPEKMQPAEGEDVEAPEIMGIFFEESAGPEMGGPSAVYQIDGQGSAVTLWTAPEMAMIFSMVMGPRGELIVGSGAEGRLYSVVPGDNWSMLADGEETQVLALLGCADGDVLVGTGNLGKVFRLDQDYVKEGTLESESHDAAVAAQWGRLSWEAAQPSGTKISLQTRSGNSEVPDETWSPWSKVYGEARGEAIESPAARFIQWRANLTSSKDQETPALEKVWLAYVQHNLTPRVLGIHVHPAANGAGQGANFAQREGGPTVFGNQGEPAQGDFFGGKDVSRQGMRKASWHAYDPNGDRLSYHLYYRGEGEQRWKTLEEDLKISSHTWDTRSFPDGSYRLRVEASDNPDNPQAQALSAQKDSDPFVVDNTPPRVVQVKGQAQQNGRYLITGKAIDEHSPIVELWYSIDAEDWEAMTTRDGVFDGFEETFSFTTESLPAGEHTIMIKASDMAGNVGAGKAVVR